MIHPRGLLIVVALTFLGMLAAPGQEAPPADAKLPMSGLAPAKPFPDNCLVRYRISTESPQCQAFFDQGLGYFYSYVWVEAVRSFETATRHDPDCAMAWWGLCRALEQWKKRDVGLKALEKARDKKDRCPHNEQLLITAALQEKGLVAALADANARRQAAIRTIDELLSLYDDDQEGWFCRAQLANGGKFFGGDASSVLFYKALLRINPLHPGANHELVHYYETCRRPALGWNHAENYMKSSPGIPHPFHMQSHLAMRLGRFEKTADRALHAVELQRKYHREQGVKPAEDQQFSHHLETLTFALVHDARYTEARKIKEECQSYGYRFQRPWFRLHLAERNWEDALKIVDMFRKTDKQTTSYLTALVYLRQGDVERAAAEVEVLRHSMATIKDNKIMEGQFWESQGILLCQMGAPEGGLKFLAKLVERTKDDYAHHAWGNGAYFMETWGVAALKSSHDDVAEEAFLEALAHEPSCARAALGLQVLCERQGRKEESQRYADLARRCWQKADANALQNELTYLRELYPACAPAQPKPTTSEPADR